MGGVRRPANPGVPHGKGPGSPVLLAREVSTWLRRVAGPLALGSEEPDEPTRHPLSGVTGIAWPRGRSRPSSPLLPSAGGVCIQIVNITLAVRSLLTGSRSLHREMKPSFKAGRCRARTGPGVSLPRQDQSRPGAPCFRRERHGGESRNPPRR